MKTEVETYTNVFKRFSATEDDEWIATAALIQFPAVRPVLVVVFFQAA